MRSTPVSRGYRLYLKLKNSECRMGPKTEIIHDYEKEAKTQYSSTGRSLSSPAGKTYLSFYSKISKNITQYYNYFYLLDSSYI